MRQAMSTPTAYGITAFFARQHAADRQAVADVRIRHQRRPDRVRHLAGRRASARAPPSSMSLPQVR